MRPFVFSLIVVVMYFGIAPVAAQEITKPVEVKSSDKNPERDDKAALNMLAWLAPTEQAAQQIITYLQKKVGQEVTMPAYPSTGITYWQGERYPVIPAEGTLSSVYFSRVHRLLYEDTLVLTHLLKAIENLKNKPTQNEKEKQKAIAERAQEVQNIAYTNFLWVWSS